MRFLFLLPRLFLCAVLVLNGTIAVTSAADPAGACHAQGEAPKSTDHGGSDCCKRGDGGCYCAHAFAPTALPNALIAVGPHAGSMHALSSDHYPPTLPEPIRPPIV